MFKSIFKIHLKRCDIVRQGRNMLFVLKIFNIHEKYFCKMGRFNTFVLILCMNKYKNIQIMNSFDTVLIDTNLFAG